MIAAAALRIVIATACIALAIQAGKSAHGQSPGPLSAASRPSAEVAAQTHGVVLFLTDGPIHIRLYVASNGVPLETIRDNYLRELVETLDVDADGKVGHDETTKHPLFVSGRRFTGNKFLNSLRTRRTYSDAELNLAVDRAAGQLIAIRQNNELVDQDLAVFSVLDENQSGLIERAEMRTAANRIAARDLDFDKCVTFDEFVDQPVVQDVLGLSIAEETAPTSVHSSMLRNASEPILAPRLVRTYDDDRDAHLSRDELGWSQARFDALDWSGDGRLSVQELSALTNQTPDLCFAVDFEISSNTAPALTLLDARSELGLDTSRENIVKFRRSGATISIGYRHRDPMQEAETNALEAFNVIDVDANGYLDREEIEDHQRFERYLFAAMDTDDDERVFAEELLSYVRAYTKPATTSCRVSLFDTGNGYFQMLDGNSDGRVSVRELRSMEESLLKISDADEINPSMLPKSYRIEIVRGGASLFGSVNRREATAPEALLQDPVGPIWFQRMDRNSDGDLTWDEFLGPRVVFHQLDSDQDSLIDPQEARAAAQLYRDKPAP